MQFYTRSSHFRDIKVEMFNIQKVGYGHGVQFFAMLSFDDKYQNVQNVVPCIFLLAVTASEILRFLILDLQKVCQFYLVQLLQMMPFDFKIYKSCPLHF